jgi:CSLREA domain-containing protein
MTALRYALILALVFLPASPFATTFPVTKTDDTDDGTCDPDCSLREAIDAANTNPGADDVPVPAGTYLLTLGQLVVSDDLSIAGAGQADTILDGNASDRVFEIQYGIVAEISGVTIQNGYNTGSGGGILNDGDLTLTNSTVSGNYASGWGAGGGGIYNNPGGYLTLTNSRVSGNTAQGSCWEDCYGGYGGGIHNWGNLTLTNSTVSGNNAVFGGYGGGIWNRGGLTLTDSTVSGNYAGFRGGGIFSWGGSTLTNSTLSGNSAPYGGGIFNHGGNDYLTLTNSTVSGNTATTPVGGGGIDRFLFPNTAYLANSVVADNGLRNCGSPVGSLGYNLSDDASCGLTATGDLVVADAMLGPLQNNGGPTETHDLLPGSPAIDAGSVSCPPPDTDQRGVARPQGMDCDIGAVEYLPEPRGALVLIAGAGFLGFLYRRRTRGLRRASRC